MTVVAFPFVIVPGVLIVLWLAAFFLLELLVWVPIQLGALGGARLGKGARRKEVLPRLDLTTTGRAPRITAPAIEGQR